MGGVFTLVQSKRQAKKKQSWTNLADEDSINDRSLEVRNAFKYNCSKRDENCCFAFLRKINRIDNFKEE